MTAPRVQRSKMLNEIVGLANYRRIRARRCISSFGSGQPLSQILPRSSAICRRGSDVQGLRGFYMCGDIQQKQATGSGCC